MSSLASPLCAYKDLLLKENMALFITIMYVLECTAQTRESEQRKTPVEVGQYVFLRNVNIRHLSDGLEGYIFYDVKHPHRLSVSALALDDPYCVELMR
jgi:hypothetical protein